MVEPQPDGRFLLRDDGAETRPDIARGLVAATVVWRLNAIAAATTGHLVIHAGSVAGTGAVLLPGPSGTGKSTLVAACIAAGLSYLSDEYAAVDLRDATVTPYAKPLGLEAEALVVASSLRPDAVGSPRSPAGIVFPRYEAGRDLSVTRLDPGWTLLGLAAHATNRDGLGRVALPWLAGLATACPAWQVTYGDAAEAVASVMTAARVPVVVRPADPIGPVTPTTTTVALGDGMAVLHEASGNIHLLNAGASFVWTCVADAPDRSRLADVALALAPAGTLDPGEIAATVEQLTRSGLLTDEPA